MSRERLELKTYVDKHAVVLNIYDLGSANNYLQTLGLGLYHTGTHIFNSEFNYGGHPFDGTGIYEIEPKSAQTIGNGFTFKESILIGYTEYSEHKVRQILYGLGQKRFKGKSYHLFRNNCNHFTNTLIRELCGEEIPKWINRISRIGSNIPFLEYMLPLEVLSPTLCAVPEEGVSKYALKSGANMKLNDAIICRKKSNTNYIV